MARAEELKNSRGDGKFTLDDVITIAVEFNLGFKAATQWLEYGGILPTATWERIYRRLTYPVDELLRKWSCN